MPRKTSSVGVLQKFISKNQNTVGFTSSSGGGNSALVQQLQSYINVNVKPQFITDYLNNQTDDLDNYILTNYTTVLNNFLSDSDTSYLAGIGISILQITSKGRTDFRILSEEIQRLEERVDELGGNLLPRQSPEVIRAVVEADVSLDVRYLLYIQKYGVPPGGVFDPVLLAEFDGYDN
jgi:Ni2+-binding GTPase involved in maturation of urease and hydrogenase